MTNEETIEVLDDMKIKIDIPKAAITQRKRNEALDKAIKAIEQTSWIPVSERLPLLTGKYLVTVKNGNVYAAVFDSWSGRFQVAATAWMSLPEPYKAESEDKK